MALVNGTNLVLYVDDSGTDKAFGHSRSFTLNVEANPIDVTSRESAGWSEFIMGSRSFTLDFEGLVSFSDDINYEWLMDAIKDETKFLVKFTDNLNGPLVYNGYVYLTSLSIDSPTEDVVTYSGTLQGTEILATAIAPSPGDPDASAFLSAAGITDATITEAINGLVEDLKTASLWNKFYAIYPFVGGTASTHKFNLKNPANTDAAYRLQFNGTWTHDANGIVPAIAGGAQPTDPGSYANTFMVSKDLTNFHLSYYSKTSEASAYSDNAFGVTDYSTSDATVLQLSIRDSSNNAIAQINSSAAEYTNTNGLGFYIGSRASQYVTKLYKNGSLVASQTGSTAETGNMAIPLVLGNSNTGSGNYYVFNTTNKRCAFASVGTAFTDAEAASFYTIVQNFQTALSRQV